MILKIYVCLISILVLIEFPSTNGALSHLASNLVMKAVKKRLPLDYSLALFDTLPFITKKYYKMTNLTGGPLPGVMLEATELLKENFFSPTIDEYDISYHIFKKGNSNLGSLKIEDFAEKEGKVFVLIHGWIEDATDVSDWCKEMAKTLMDKFEKSRVVVVDWGTSSNKFLYPLAASRTQAVGKLIADKLKTLVENKNVPLNNIVLIGYDLGAHVCGFAGKAFQKSNPEKLPLIIALDPSAFLFEGKPESQRLDKTDAETVMVVHTSSSMIGFTNSCGTIDFYPNGGSSQPGCMSWNLLCNHQRSPLLLTSAIASPEMFPTKKCNSSKDYQEGNCEDADVLFGNISETSEGVCLIESESGKNTSRITTRANHRQGLGLFQILSRDWCTFRKRGGMCNVRCEDMLDEDLTDDSTCAKKIMQELGFNAWNGWKRSCKRRNLSIPRC